MVAASCRLDRSFKHTSGALSFQMWCNFGLAKPWPGFALKDKYWRKLRGNSHKLEWLAVIPYAYKGKPLVDAAVKAIAQTSNYLHAMSCLFTNAAIQYKKRNLIAEVTDRESRIWKWPCIHLQDNLTYGNTRQLTILLYALLQDCLEGLTVAFLSKHITIISPIFFFSCYIVLQKAEDL